MEVVVLDVESEDENAGTTPILLAKKHPPTKDWGGRKLGGAPQRLNQLSTQ